MGSQRTASGLFLAPSFRQLRYLHHGRQLRPHPRNHARLWPQRTPQLGSRRPPPRLRIHPHRHSSNLDHARRRQPASPTNHPRPQRIPQLVLQIIPFSPLYGRSLLRPLGALFLLWHSHSWLCSWLGRPTTILEGAPSFAPSAKGGLLLSDATNSPFFPPAILCALCALSELCVNLLPRFFLFLSQSVNCKLSPNSTEAKLVDPHKPSHLRHAPHRTSPHRPLFRRPAKLGQAPIRSRVRMFLLRRRLARPHLRLRRHLRHRRKLTANHHRFPSLRPRPSQIYNLSPVSSPRTRRTPSPSQHDHSARLARTHPHLQRAARPNQKQRPPHLRLPRLPHPPNCRHRHVFGPGFTRRSRVFCGEGGQRTSRSRR